MSVSSEFSRSRVSRLIRGCRPGYPPSKEVLGETRIEHQAMLSAESNPGVERDANRCDTQRAEKDLVANLAAIRGFYERMSDVERGINHGFFITPEEVDSRKGARTTDFLQGHSAVRVKMVKVGYPPRVRTGWEPQGLDGR